jgi:hypothetical protein
VTLDVLDVRALDLDDPAEVALGRALVEEYVEFTADLGVQAHGPRRRGR